MEALLIYVIYIGIRNLEKNKYKKKQRIGGMGMQNFENWYKLVSDNNVLRILLYLEKYNPAVRIKDLKTDLKLDEDAIKEIISKLSKENIIVIQNKEFVELTERGRIAVERLMTIA